MTMSMYPAQRTNFKTTMPRIALKPGQQRQIKPRSMNRGKADPSREMLLKFALYNGDQA